MKATRTLLAMAMACFVVMGVSCKKNHVNPTPDPSEDPSTVTGIGVPDGSASSKTIGVGGGSLVSTDGKLTISIPAGALATDKVITIQPITNKLPSGLGKAYRITPHGEQFAKPVTLKIKYAEEDLLNTYPEFLDIAFQDENQTWQGVMDRTLDKTNKTIAITTTHFSDWGYFKNLTLSPKTETVDLGGYVPLELRTTYPYLDPDDPANSPYKPVYTNPRKLRPDEIKGWSYSGQGSLVADGSNAHYYAPDKEPNTNPEAVAVNINLHRKGQFMLVSNITVLSGHGVDYLQVDEDSESPLNKGKCMLYMWGSFGTDPGVAKRSVNINGVTVAVNLWTPTIIRCEIDENIFGPIDIVANGKSIARTVLRRFKGKFLYTRYHGGVSNAGSSNPLKEVHEYELVYRGFGKPCPSNVNKLFTIDGSLSSGSNVRYTLSGAASVSTPPSNGCVSTTSVSLTSTTDWYFLLPKSMETDQTGWWTEVDETSNGINLKMEFLKDDLIPGVKVQRSNSCGPSSFDPPRSLGVLLEGFNHKTIELEFVGTDGLRLKGVNELKSPRMSSGILIEAWDGTGSPSHYETDGLMQAIFKNNF